MAASQMYLRSENTELDKHGGHINEAARFQTAAARKPFLRRPVTDRFHKEKFASIQ